MATPWSPQSWQGLPARQQPDYPDPSALEAVLDRLRRLPPLVGPGEVERLRSNFINGIKRMPVRYTPTS